jgi:membrane fusion protein (multidrug efflux system)
MKISIHTILILVAFVAGIIVNASTHKKTTENNNNLAVAVTAIKLEKNAISISEELPGRANAYQIAEVRPQVGGIVLDRLFAEGSIVEKGQQLYQIDPAPYKLAYESAEADLSKAEAMLKSVQAQEVRYKELIKVEAISKQEFDNIKSSLEQAKADVSIAKAVLNSAKLNLDYTKVYAPIKGKIGKSSVTTGALVNNNQASAIATITQLDPIYIDVNTANQNNKFIYDNPKNNKAIATLYPNNNSREYEHKGDLQFSEVIMNPTTGSIPIRLLFPNPEGKILPGMFVRAGIKYTVNDAILVPQQAAMRGPDGELKIWLISSDNKVHPVTIKAERTIGNAWLVSEGVTHGDKIVLEGFQKLKPGVLVDITETIDNYQVQLPSKQE